MYKEETLCIYTILSNTYIIYSLTETLGEQMQTRDIFGIAVCIVDL